MMMRSLPIAILCGALVSVPVAAQEIAAPAAAAQTQIPKLNLRKISFDAAKTASAAQTTQAQPQPVRSAETGAGIRAGYIVSLVAASAGTVYMINQTRDALDRKLEVRTFPVVWWKTSNPDDKNKATLLVGGINAALMGLSAVAYHGHNPRTGILINAVVAAATFAVGFNDHSKIKDDKVACPVISACR